MRTKSIILLIVALGFGLIASIGMSQLASKGAAEAIPTVSIYVTTANITLGEEVTESNVALEKWPADRVPEGAISTPEALENMVPVQPLFAGEPLLVSKLVDKSRQVGAADRIKPGYVVVSVKVSMDTAVSHLIRPGDHVDIISASRQHGKSELVLSNIEVFAINDVTRRVVDDESGSMQAKTVSVQVTSEQAAKLAYSADASGAKLRLALRSKQDDGLESDAGRYGNSTFDMNQSMTDLPVEEVREDQSFHMEIVDADGKIQRYTWDDISSEKLPNEVADGSAPSFGGNHVPVGDPAKPAAPSDTEDGPDFTDDESILDDGPVGVRDGQGFDRAGPPRLDSVFSF